MFNRMHALETNDGKATGHVRDALGVVASIAGLALVAAVAPLLIHTIPDNFNATPWLLLVALAQPGMFATWALLHRRMAIHAEGQRAPTTVLASVLMVAASFSLLVFVVPFILEVWLWA